jgi:hypothetical protein
MIPNMNFMYKCVKLTHHNINPEPLTITPLLFTLKSFNLNTLSK